MTTAANEYDPPRADLAATGTAAHDPGSPDPAGLPGPTAGHPVGLYVLFGAEMWERFSYYGMRALLVLYLVYHLQYADKDAKAMYATYTGLVYLTPILGGLLADRFLGQRKAILIGAVVMAMGHFAMAFESMLFLALSLLIIGNGFFKPNISTMVGNLYPQGDARRDSAYTIFYIGINLGAFIAPLACGYLAESKSFGWHYGFGLAGIGMVLGLISFLVFQDRLVGGFPPGSTQARLTATDGVHVVLASLICLGAAYGFGRAWPAVQPYIGHGIKVIMVLYLLGLVYAFARVARGGDTEEGIIWQRLAVILVVGLFSIVFWMGFEQAGGNLNLFAKEKTDRATSLVQGGEFPASWFQSVNSLFILALASLFSILWATLDRTRFKLSSPGKMGFGLIALGLGFVVMRGAEAASADGKVSPTWLVGFYFLATVGELCLSPIGLSLVNKLAPAKVASLMMALWFTCTAIANYLAGTIDVELERFHVPLFPFLIVVSAVSGIVLLVLTKPLTRMGHGRL